jgi:hypothetical protein
MSIETPHVIVLVLHLKTTVEGSRNVYMYSALNVPRELVHTGHQSELHAIVGWCNVSVLYTPTLRRKIKTNSKHAIGT